MIRLTKRGYLVLSALSAVVLVGLILWSLIGRTDTKSSGGSGTNSTSPQASSKGKATTSSSVHSISNYDKTVQNLSTDESDNIYRQLINTLKLNGVSQTITDATIRDGTYSQKITDNNKMIYYTTFIIDIPSLKQSYQVQDTYSPLPATASGLGDYTTLILCPDNSQLIYGEFNCLDRLKQEQRGY